MTFWGLTHEDLRNIIMVKIRQIHSHPRGVTSRLRGSNAPWIMCWFRRYINCLFVCLLFSHFIPPSLLSSFLMLSFLLIYFLTCLLQLFSKLLRKLIYFWYASLFQLRVLCLHPQHNLFPPAQIITACQLIICNIGWSNGWLRGTVVERRSLAGDLSLSCARPVADEWPLMSVSRPL